MGCWPLAAQILLTRDTVTWRDFRNGHRNWDLSAFGPFTFDRTRHEMALQPVIAVTLDGGPLIAEVDGEPVRDVDGTGF
jgi:hypothetical protein